MRPGVRGQDLGRAGFLRRLRWGRDGRQVRQERQFLGEEKDSTFLDKNNNQRFTVHNMLYFERHSRTYLRLLFVCAGLFLSRMRRSRCTIASASLYLLLLFLVRTHEIAVVMGGVVRSTLRSPNVLEFCTYGIRASFAAHVEDKRACYCGVTSLLRTET